MDNLQVFNFNENEVRTVLIENEPYFVGRDVAYALGYSDTNKAVMMHVDEEDKKLNDKSSLSFGQRGATLINESGVYSLVFGSKLPEAKKFKRWVTSEVLPKIRQTGCYKLPTSYKEAVQHLLTQIEENEHLQLENQAMKPKALFADAVETSETSILVGDLAKLIKQNGVDIGQKRLFEWMRKNSFLIKGGSSKNMPTQKAMELKLFEVKERTISNPDGSVRVTKTTKVTGKGQIYFVNKFCGNLVTAL